MVVTNEQDLILYVVYRALFPGPWLTLTVGSVYDWLHKRKVSQFFNGNPLGSSITSLHFINEEVAGIILTGAGEYLQIA